MAQLGKESACNAGVSGDAGSIPVLGRSPEAGHSNPLQCSCLENAMDRGAWWAIDLRVAESWTQLKTEQQLQAPPQQVYITIYL